MTTEPSTGNLIAITGIDGAGKTTLAATLAKRAIEHGNDTKLVEKHTVDVPGALALSHHLDAVNAVVYRPDAAVGQAVGDHYWLFALAAWYTLQDRLVIRPALQRGTTVILDNTHHKILARYAVHSEVPTGLAQQVFAHLTPADTVLFLAVDPEEALRRKERFTALEAGRTGTADEHFVTYQNRVTAALHSQADPTWSTIDVTTRTPDSVLDAALTILDERRLLAMPHRTA